ncbi:hypothetical protein [Spirillospora sp. CA-294931]|uniref:hypothetical protein n=1 Tax=Spirillospora sp. CA-294931 TaxID=3240042 RepID=UPI003D901CB1
MSERQASARRFLDEDLIQAVEVIDSAAELAPETGLPASPELDAELDKARRALTKARSILLALTSEETGRRRQRPQKTEPTAERGDQNA